MAQVVNALDRRRSRSTLNAEGSFHVGKEVRPVTNSVADEELIKQYQQAYRDRLVVLPDGAALYQAMTGQTWHSRRGSRVVFRWDTTSGRQGIVRFAMTLDDEVYVVVTNHDAGCRRDYRVPIDQVDFSLDPQA